MMREVFILAPPDLVDLHDMSGPGLDCRVGEQELKPHVALVAGGRCVSIDGEGRGCGVGSLQRGGQRRLTFRGFDFTIPEVVVPYSSSLPKPLDGCAAGSLQLLGSPSDGQLVALVRGGQRGAFDALVARYEARLLWLCRRMLGSVEDAEDALQDVFVSAFNAIVADEREICVRPWLYRIARNRCLDKLSRPTSVGVGSMDDFCAETDRGLVEQVVARQQLFDLVGDVRGLPVRQSTALLLREVDGLSYRQIALATRTTVPGVKSLLVRARAGLVASVAARETPPVSTCLRATPGRSRTRTREGALTVGYPTARAAANACA